MPMTVAVTRDVAPRIRGFLASVMVEVAPGVYVGPRMTHGVRWRIIEVLNDWQMATGGAVTLIWQDNRQPGGLDTLGFGVPARELHEVDGLCLSRTPLDGEELVKLGLRKRSLKTESKTDDKPVLPSPGRPTAPGPAKQDGKPPGGWR